MKILTTVLNKLLLTGLLFVTAFSLQAKELAGVSLEQQVTVSGIAAPLKLNGAGIRYKFFFKIYVGALYLSGTQSDAALILKSNQPNRISMHFLYDEVPKEKLVNAWVEGFIDNNEKASYEAVKDRLGKFNLMFSDVHKGDVVLLDYLPGTGTRVSIKGEEKGIIEGADFNRALLAVWLGDDPVTEELKDAMLGIEEEQLF